jgi:hypothetical protein
MTKLIKAFTDIKIVGGVLISIIMVLSAYADSTYIRKSSIQTILDIHEVKEIRRSISSLQVRLGFADNKREKTMYVTLIKIKENQIKELKGE